jgi:hypothetical protein
VSRWAGTGASGAALVIYRVATCRFISAWRCGGSTAAVDRYAERGAAASRSAYLLAWCAVGLASPLSIARGFFDLGIILLRESCLAFFRTISDRGPAYSEAPGGKGRAPMPSISAIVGRVRSLRAAGNASRITHQRHRSLSLGPCRPPFCGRHRRPFGRASIAKVGAAENSEYLLKGLHGENSNRPS